MDELEEKIQLAYEDLHIKNEKYNELLTEIYEKKDGISNDSIDVLCKKKKIHIIIYLSIIALLSFSTPYFNIPTTIYRSIFIADIAYLMGVLYYFNYKIYKASNEGFSSKRNIKDEKEILFEELSKARELYYSLKKQKESMLYDEIEKEKENIISENIEIEDTLENNLKVKSLTKHFN